MKFIKYTIALSLLANIAYCYDPPNGLPSTIDVGDYGKVTNSSVLLEADGYYNTLNNGKTRYDSSSPNIYGRWLNTGISLVQGMPISIKISGNVARSYNTVYKFDPTIGPTQNSGIQFQAGDSLELLINPTLPNGSTAINYVNQGCDLFSDQAYTNSSGACNANNVVSVCINPPPVEKSCYTSDGAYHGDWGIHGSGLNILYGNIQINDSNQSFATQSLINPSLGTGGFNANGFYIYSLQNNGSLNFQSLDGCDRNTGTCWANNIGNYAFSIKKIFNSVNNANSSENSFGTVDYTIYSYDPNNDPTNINGNYTIVNLNAIAGTSYTLNVNNSGTLWLRVHDDAPLPFKNNIPNRVEQLNYFNINFNNSFPTSPLVYSFTNIGRYIVNVDYVNNDAELSSLISKITLPIQTAINTAAENVYISIISKQSFKSLVQYSIVLYIIFYACMFIFGMVQVTQVDLVTRIFKMGVLFALIATTTSWNFFNNYLLNAFLNGNIYLINLATGEDPSNNPNSIFRFVDLSIGNFFTKYTWIKISALLFNPVGFIVVIMIIYGMFVYILCLIEMIIGYLISLIAIAFTIAIAPLLLACILFERTKTYFTNWINYLTSFSLQPVILFGSIYLVYELVLLSFQIAISYKVTWGCAIPMNIFGISFCISYYKPADGYSYLDIFIGALMFMMFIKVFKGMLDFAPFLIAMITQTTGAPANITGEGSQARGQVNKGIDLLKKAVKTDDKSKSDRNVASAAKKEGGGTPRPPIPK